jgi:signal transduction histidine kinase
MALPALDLGQALEAAATRIAEAMQCDKIDAFLLDEARRTLTALGTSDTPMGRMQKALGLDALPLANGGRIVETFETGTNHFENHCEQDAGELHGLVEHLGIRSTISVPLEVNGVRRGVLSAASGSPDFFAPEDLNFLEIVARWLGTLAHRAELTELTQKVDREEARRQGAEEIVTVLAHDLRNHLQPLLARLQLMRIRIDSGKAVEAGDVERALQSVRRVSRLMDDLLDLKRLDEGLFSLNLAPVSLMKLAEETAAALGTASVPARATGDRALYVVGDEARLRQALENLVANALKYSPHGQAVEIHVASSKCDAKDCGVLEVLDTGPGISAEVASRLFDRFVSSADSKGLGLGLHLAKRIAGVHGGELSVHPRATGGTSFRLAIPLEGPSGDGT